MRLEARQRLLASDSAAIMFDTKSIHDYAIPANKGREKLVEMDIDDFLNMAKPLDEPSEYKLDPLWQSVSSGEKLHELPTLFIDTSRDGTAVVDGHEGRHRALTLKRLGYTSMPVILKTGGLRWSEQSDPNRFDYYEKWPKTLKGESGKTIPFPVSRDNAMTPYR